MTNESDRGRSDAVPNEPLTPRATELCALLETHDWDFRAAAEANRIEPRLLYRDWLEALGWNQSLAARLYRRGGRSVTRQAIEAQMKSLGVVRPLDLARLLRGQDLEGGLDALRASADFVREESNLERLCAEQWLALAETYRAMDAQPQARAALVQVVKLARQTNASGIVARAVRALPDLAYQVRPYGSYDAELVDLLDGWLVMLRQGDDSSALALALGLLAQELYAAPNADARARALRISDEALEAARAAGVPETLSSVTGQWVLCRSDAAHLEARIETLESLIATVPLAGDHRFHVLGFSSPT